jgi:hypothetical protein
VAAPEAKKPKALTDFERQNPAAKRLVREVDEAMKIMLASMIKEIRAVLEPDSKGGG